MITSKLDGLNGSIDGYTAGDLKDQVGTYQPGDGLPMWVARCKYQLESTQSINQSCSETKSDSGKDIYIQEESNIVLQQNYSYECTSTSSVSCCPPQRACSYRSTNFWWVPVMLQRIRRNCFLPILHREPVLPLEEMH